VATIDGLTSVFGSGTAAPVCAGACSLQLWLGSGERTTELRKSIIALAVVGLNSTSLMPASLHALVTLLVVSAVSPTILRSAHVCVRDVVDCKGSTSAWCLQMVRLALIEVRTIQKLIEVRSDE
jgi:hypothetical protein